MFWTVWEADSSERERKDEVKKKSKSPLKSLLGFLKAASLTFLSYWQDAQ
jgi:hypothetical protein